MAGKDTYGDSLLLDYSLLKTHEQSEEGNKNNDDYSKHAQKDSGVSASSDSHSIAGSPTNNNSRKTDEIYQSGAAILR